MSKPYLEQKLAERIDDKLATLESLRPLPATALKKLQEHFALEMTYNSNAIEGSSLTFNETFLVINEGITVKGKALKDHLAATDHHQALEMLYELIDKKHKSSLSQQTIRSLHQLIVQKTEADFAGKYRNSNVYIAGAKHRPPEAILVPEQMQKLLSWFIENKNKLHPIELAATFHHRLVYIHPFFDGNGRTARLVMNLILLRASYPLAVILKNDRQKYYRALSAADQGDLALLVKLVAQMVERSLDIYLKTLDSTGKKKENYFLLSDVSKKTAFSAKYLNLLINQSKLEGHKEGRNWLTSKEAVDRYLDRRSRKRKTS